MKQAVFARLMKRERRSLVWFLAALVVGNGAAFAQSGSWSGTYFYDNTSGLWIIQVRSTVAAWLDCYAPWNATATGLSANGGGQMVSGQETLAVPPWPGGPPSVGTVGVQGVAGLTASMNCTARQSSSAPAASARRGSTVIAPPMRCSGPACQVE